MQRQLGDEDITITLNIYSHVLPSMQSDAVGTVGSGTARVTSPATD